MTTDQSTSQLVPAHPTHAPLPSLEGWDRVAFQRIWLGTQVRPWQTLAVVPGEVGMSTVKVASIVAALGMHHGESVGFADLRDIGLNRIPEFLQLVALHAARGEKLVFATSSPRENLASIPLARAADAALLCVSLGTTRVALVEELIDQIGKERFVGSLLLPPPARGSVGFEARELSVKS